MLSPKSVCAPVALVAMIVGSSCLASDLGSLQVRSDAQLAYFEVTNVGPNDTFVIALRDPAKIAQARNIVANAAKLHVIGTVIKQTAPYNPPWHFHLGPESISFVELSAEVCDATTAFVENHLAEVGGAFLPKGLWCPWQSRLVRELERR